MTALGVRALLDELKISARSTLHGFVLAGGARIESGSGNGGRWTIVDVRTGRAISEASTTRSGLRCALIAWRDLAPKRLIRAQKRIETLERELADARRDLSDMHGARQTRFKRCACGRMAEVEIICPTNQEGGNCEDGK